MKKSETTFTPEEQLNLFVDKVNEIGCTQLLKKGFKLGFKGSLSNYQEIINSEPEEDEFRSFLITYRKFISEKEPIFMNKIFDICHQHLTDSQSKKNLEEVRQLWRNEFKTGFIKIHLNNKRYTPKEILNLWINGYYFHDDAQKKRELEELMSNSIFFLFIRHNFLFLINETTRQILFVGGLIENQLKQNNFKF